MQPILLAIIGKPLVGKDTQADRLVAAYPEAVKISTGHILRSVREEGETHRFWSLVGPLLSLMEQGMKLPDPPILEMIGRVAREKITEGKRLLIVAGSPRSFEQLEGFEAMAKDAGAKLLIVHMDATDEETYLRSATRNEGRVDDTPAVHAVRLQEYRTHVLPVLEKLRREGRVMELDGMQPREVVFEKLEDILRKTVLDPEITLPAMARR